MNCTTFEGWAAEHARRFGLFTDQDLQMLLSWREPFASAGYTVPELVEASNYIATNDPPTSRWQHLDKLSRRINAKRVADRVQVAKSAEAGGFQCDLCGGTGFVVVPHLRFVDLGEWISPFPSFAVSCGCHRGEKTLEAAANAKRPIVSLAFYTSKNPLWKDQVERKARTRELMDRAHFRASERDANASRGIDAFKKNVAASLGVPKDPAVQVNREFARKHRGEAGE